MRRPDTRHTAVVENLMTRDRIRTNRLIAMRTEASNKELRELQEKSMINPNSRLMAKEHERRMQPPPDDSPYQKFIEERKQSIYNKI